MRINRVFLKLLIAFQLAIFIGAGSLVLVSVSMGKDPLLARWMTLHSNNGSLPQLADASLEIYRMGGPAELRRYEDRTAQRIRLFLYLFDADGKEVSGKIPPDGLEDVVKKVLHSGERPLPGELLQMRRLFLMKDAQGRRFVFCCLDTDNRFTQFLGMILRSGTILAIELLLCFFVARLFMKPLLHLRQAAQSWASGDFSVRAGVVSGDEIGELAHEFDAMAARLETLMGAQKLLLADISHELRSPLARLTVAVELARRQVGEGTEKREAALKRIEREADRMNQLIGELLMLSRLESAEGRLPSHTTPVDFSELVREVVADADFEAQGCGCRVEADLPETALRLTNAEPELLRRAVENIVRNAVRYTETGTAVQIALKAEGGEILLTVRDHGLGVPEAALTELFQPFYRVGSDRDRASGGVGLGLAITERAVHLHGGTVTAANMPDGSGLCITLCLPTSPP